MPPVDTISSPTRTGRAHAPHVVAYRAFTGRPSPVAPPGLLLGGIVQISPSILSADFANLQAELAAIRSADSAHIDVMDNHFVPNLTLGLPVVESLRKVSPVPLDCHLMIDDPDRGRRGMRRRGPSR